MKASVFSEANELRLDELAQLFRLPTLAATMTRRLTEAGHADALPVVLEVFEHEHEGRHQRRVERLRRAAQLPPGKTFATLDEGTFPRPLLAKLRELAKGGFDERIYVRGSKTVNYGRVAEVMSLITSAGYKKVALVTEQERK